MRARLLLIPLLLVIGCDDDLYSLYQNSSPQPLGGALAYLDTYTSSLVIVDPAGKAGENGGRKLHRIDAGEAPSRAISVPRADVPGTTQVLVIDPGGKQILVVRDESGLVDTVPLGVPLEAIDVSADGSYAIAYQPEGVAPADSLLGFPNTIAIIDLSADQPTAQTLRLSTGGARPIAAVFSESLSIERTIVTSSGTSTELRELPVALVFVRGGLIPVDLATMSAGDMVPVTDSDRSVVPAEVLFTNNRGDALSGEVDGIERAFVRTNDGELFVFALSLTGDGPEPLVVALDNLITPAASAATVHDAELFFDEAGRSVLLAAAGDELILVDGYSGVDQRFDAPIYTDSLVRFTDSRTGEDLCLGYSSTSDDYQLVRLNPLMLAEHRSTGMETMSLGKPVTRIEISEAGTRAILSYYGGKDLGILDLTGDGQVTDVSFAYAPTARTLLDDGERMLLVVESADDSRPHLAEVTFGEDIGLREVELLEFGYSVGQVGDYLWVDHATNEGDVTFFPVDNLDLEAVIAFHGIFFTRLLDEEPLTGDDQ